jgi:voltage-gated potassium channel
VINIIRIKRNQRKIFRHIKIIRKDLKKSLVETLLYLILIIVAHTLAMWQFENLSFANSVWLTLTTVTTVGYGDFSATTFMGRLSTVLFLYIGGIFVLGKAAGDYFEYRNDNRERKLRGNWSWEMSNHIVILNKPNMHGSQYFYRLIDQFHQSEKFHFHPVQILTTAYPNGLPRELRENDGVLHYNGSASEIEDLKAVGADQAEIVVLLAMDETNQESDGQTFDILHRLKEIHSKALILAECVDDRNRQRLYDAGASVVIRPMRAYPEMIVRSFVAPGSEQIIENMFNSKRDEYHRFNVTINNKRWSEIVCSCINHGIGTAVGYQSSDDKKIHCNPKGDREINADAIFVIVREESGIDLDYVKDKL